jgi:hypothetical protein
MPRALQHLVARSSQEAPTLPRRRFLKLSGASGLALGAFPYLAQAAGETASGLKPTQQPSAFVQIAPNGEVTVTINRLEFGQGVQTGLPMILAEELDADWSLVRSRNGSSDPAYLDPLFGCRPAGVSDLDRRSGCDERSSQSSDELLSVPDRSIRHPMLNARKAPGLTPFTDAPNLFRRSLGGDPQSLRARRPLIMVMRCVPSRIKGRASRP